MLKQVKKYKDTDISIEEFDEWIKELEKAGLNPLNILLYLPIVNTVLSCVNFGSKLCKFNIIKNRDVCERCKHRKLFGV